MWSWGSGRTGRQFARAVPWWTWILLIVFVEAVVVVVIDPTSWSIARSGDGAEYQRLARNLLDHSVFSEAPFAPFYPAVARGPGYPAFLAAIEWVGGAHPVFVQLVQFCLLGATAIFAGLIGREVSGPRVGNLVSLMTAVYLPLIALTAFFLTQVLSTLLLTAAVWLICRARRSGARSTYATLALVLAALTYIRAEYSLLAVPVVLLAVLQRPEPWRTGRRWVPAAAFAAIFVVLLVPWTIRNLSVSGGSFVPGSANSGSTAIISADQYKGWVADKMDTTGWTFYDRQLGRIARNPSVGNHSWAWSIEFVDAKSQVALDNRYQAAADRIFSSVPTATFVKDLPKRVAYSWTTGYFWPVRRLASVLHALAYLQYALLLAAGLVGVVIRRRRLLSDWPLLFAPVYLTLLHLYFYADGTYTLEARPALMVYSSVGMLAAAAAARRAAGGGRMRQAMSNA
jgi:hypothetical protein